VNTGPHETFTPKQGPSVHPPRRELLPAADATGDNKSELKNQELVVGAPGFEPGTSCAQGRRATRLRYAPT
jgi:hypothetical protein